MVTSVRLSRGDRGANVFSRKAGGIGDHEEEVGGEQTDAPLPLLFKFDETTRKLLG